jgi:hypothetical protein
MKTCNSYRWKQYFADVFNPELDPTGTNLGKVEITDEDVANTFTFKVVSDDTCLCNR